METIIPWLIQYHLPAMFAGTFIFGDSVMLASAFLSARGWWSLQTVFEISLVATVLADSVWFLVGHLATGKKIWLEKKEENSAFFAYIKKHVGSRPYRVLLIIKFIYGTRIITIVYLALRKTPFWKFLFFDTVGTILSLGVILPIGWYAGKGYGGAVTSFQKTTYILSAILLGVVVFKVLSVWVRKKITE